MSSMTRGGTKRRGDAVFSGLARGSGLVILVALAGVAVFLTVEGWPGFAGEEGIYSGKGDFLGYVWPLIFGTVLAAVLALIIATPLAVGVALVISHYAPRRISRTVGYVVDLLAAIPSVVYGLWGINFLAPTLVPGYRWLEEHLGFIPFFTGPTATTGRTILTAGVVLAVMILPIITAISREVFMQTPKLNEEAALALGATRWEMIKMAVFPYSRSGVVSAVMLGLGRALGETMAVATVLSPSYLLHASLLNPGGGTFAQNIASSFKEASPAGVGRQALIASGLVLFVITLLVNGVARLIIARRKEYSGADA